MKNTSFKVEDVFGYVIIKNSISPEQIIKPNKFFFSENNVNIKIKFNLNIYKPRKKKILLFNLVLLQRRNNFVNVNGFKTIILLRRTSFQPDSKSEYI